MTRLFGFFCPVKSAEALQACCSYAAREATSSEFAAPAPEQGYCAAPLTWRVGDVLISASGRPRYGGTLLTSESKAEITEIVDGYRNDPLSVPRSLDGPFSVAVLDIANRSALLAVDRMGIERMTYACEGRDIVFGTSASSVASFPGRRRRVRDQALYDFLFSHMIASPNAVYEGVQKLPPASAVTFQDGRPNVKCYWQPRYDYSPRHDFDSLKETLFAALRMSVAESGLDEPTGAFLSGGLDSSSVAGILAGLNDEPARVFTVGFGLTEYDELEFARTASAHFGCESYEYHMRPADIVTVFERIASSYDEPFGNSSAAPTYFCAKLAADNGITHLLAGDGGDELFGGNERYVRQQIFEAYSRVPGALRRTLLEPLARKTGSEHWFLPLRKVASYVEQAAVPLPDRFEMWNLVFREGRQNVLDSSFADSIDLESPLKLMREVWADAPSDNLLEKMLWYDWKFTLADNDLRKVGTMCELAGIRVSYPMLNSRVVDLATHVPPALKIRRLELRTFFKLAMRDFLPEKILRKTKHGFGLPFGQWLKTDHRLGDLIYSLLSDLKKRRIVSEKFLSDLVDNHRAGHASYYGYAIWDFAMLEAWLVRHVDADAAGRT